MATSQYTLIRHLRHWLEWRPWAFIGGVTLALYAFFVAADTAAGIIRAAVPALLLSYLATAVFLFCALCIILAACRIRAYPLREVMFFFVFLLGIIVFRPVLLALAFIALGLDEELGRLPETMAALPGIATFGSVSVVLCAAFFGRLVGRLIREANLLLIVTIVAAGIDLWGVYWGPVGEITKHDAGRALAAQLSASIPGIAAAAKQRLPVLSAIGIGDFLFLALFFFVMRRLHMNQRATFWITLAIMSAAPAFFLLGDRLPIAENLPGLPFIAAGMLIANRRYFKFSREELRTLAAAGAIFAAAIVIIILIKRFLI